MNQGFIEYVKKRKQEFEKKSGKKITWDYKNKFNSKKYLNSGSIDVKDNVVLLNHKDCLKLFGYKSNGHFQQAWWDKGTKNLNQAVWFPKLYPNKEWDNSLSLDSQTITEQKKINGEVVKIGFTHYELTLLLLGWSLCYAIPHFISILENIIANISKIVV